VSADWLGELEKPTATFFEAFAHRASGAAGPATSITANIQAVADHAAATAAAKKPAQGK